MHRDVGVHNPLLAIIGIGTLFILGLGCKAQIYPIIHRILITVGKILSGIFPDGFGIQTAETEGIGAIRIGPGFSVLVLPLLKIIVLVHEYVVGRVGDIFSCALILVCANVADAADGGHLVPY